MHRALRLPDVLLEVFQHLASTRDALCSASLVCRIWATVASEVMWRYATPVTLAAIPAEHRQSFAKLVRKLVVRMILSGDKATALGSVEFPRLRTLKLHVRLKAAQAVRCTTLTTLQTAGRRKSTLSLLQANAESMRIVTMAVIASTDMLIALASLPRLEVLRLHAVLLQYPAEVVVSRVRSPFPSLKILCARASSSAASQALRHFRHVRSLTLQLIDCEHVQLSGLSAFPHLACLRLTFECEINDCVTSELLAMRKLPVLHILALLAPPVTDPATSVTMSESAFSNLASVVPRVRTFAVMLPVSALSVRALKDFALRCPRAKIIYLIHPLPIDELVVSGARLFPSLEALRLPECQLTPNDEPDEATPAHIVRALRYHAPRLLVLQLTREYRTDLDVMRLWEEWRAHARVTRKAR